METIASHSIAKQRHVTHFALLALVIVMLMAGGIQAWATRTSTVCDPAPSKYYCFNVDYEDLGNYVSIQYLNYSGGLGGSADYFYVWRDEYWRQDPGSGQWFYLTGYAPSPIRTDCCLNQNWYTLGNGGYFVSDWAELSAQMRHHRNDGSGFFCGSTKEFYLSSPIGPWIGDGGGGGPC